MEEEQLLPNLPPADRRRIQLGVAHYCKHLDGLVKENTKLGRLAEAGKEQSLADGLRAEIVEAEDPADIRLYDRHRPIVEKGLELLATNMKAAKGTLKPLGYAEWIATIETDVQDLEGRLLPLFRVQGELPLEQGELAGVGAEDDGE